MTIALCFNCGELKFGAIYACHKCQVESCGDMVLDMAFTDHQYGLKTLMEFGEVVRTIRSVINDRPTGVWAFVQYVSINHPSILRIDLPMVMESKVNDALRGVELPKVVLRPPEGRSRESA